MEDHQSLVAVDDHQIAAGDLGQKRSDADDGRDFERLGHDRRVAARPADLGDEAADEPAVEIGRFAGREVVGEHQHRRRSGGRSPRGGGPAGAAAAASRCRRCRWPARPGTAFQFLKDLGVAAQRAADGVLGRIVPLADHLLQLAAELRSRGASGDGPRRWPRTSRPARRRPRRDCARSRRRPRRWPCRAAPARRPRRRARRTGEGCEIPRCPSPALRRWPRPAKRRSLVVSASAITRISCPSSPNRPANSGSIALSTASASGPTASSITVSPWWATMVNICNTSLPETGCSVLGQRHLRLAPPYGVGNRKRRSGRARPPDR